MLVSVCIPCYRSEKTLPLVVKSVREEFAKHPEFDLQFVLVNDGSPDNTFQTIKQLAEESADIVGVDLARNYGQVSAKLAALQYADGDVIVNMYDDGQHPAEGIFTLLDKMQEGDYDVVYAYFKNKKATGFKIVTSNLHNWISEAMGIKPKGVHRSSFSAWSRTVVKAMKDYHSPFISIGGYLMHVTSRFADVPVEHKKRISGSSGYTLKKLVRMWLNIFFSFSMAPLRWATTIGGFCTFAGFVWGIVLIVRKLMNHAVPLGYTSMMVLILLMGGLLMIFMGIIGEFVGRIYMTVSGMPQYCVREVVTKHGD